MIIAVRSRIQETLSRQFTIIHGDMVRLVTWWHVTQFGQSVKPTQKRSLQQGEEHRSLRPRLKQPPGQNKHSLAWEKIITLWRKNRIFGGICFWRMVSVKTRRFSKRRKKRLKPSALIGAGDLYKPYIPDSFMPMFSYQADNEKSAFQPYILPQAHSSPTNRYWSPEVG